MAITRTGVVISTNTTFGDSDDRDFYINGGQLGINQVPVSGLTPDTVYYAKGYVQQDGTTITDPSYKAFRTASERFFNIKNEYQGNNTITLTRKAGAVYAPPVIEISKDKITWTNLTYPYTSSNDKYNTITLEQGERLYMRGMSGFSTTSSSTLNIDCSEVFSIDGDILSMFDYTDTTVDTISDYGCMYLFNTGPNNWTGSQTLIGVSDSVFARVKHLENAALQRTFCDCQNLTSCNIESIITAKSGALLGTFEKTGLTSLSLPNLTASNYTSMLGLICYECTDLVDVSLPNIEVADSNIFQESFRGCTSLETVNLGGLREITNQNPFYYTFAGCSALKKVDFSSLASVSNDSLFDTFNNCTSLEEIDLRSITTINLTGQGNAPFYQTFYGCSSLTTVYGPTVSTWDSGYASFWFYNCPASGDYYNLGGATIPRGISGIPSGWTEHTSL